MLKNIVQQAAKKNTPTWKVFDAQTNNFKTFANGLEANACYEWSVRAKCDGIWTDWQDIREFCTPSAKNQNYIAANDPFLSENQETIISDLNVYPNPTSDYITLNFTSTTTEDLQLFLTDILGKTIFSKTLLTDKGEQNIRFQVSDLPKGTYFLQIVNNEEISSSIIF